MAASTANARFQEVLGRMNDAEHQFIRSKLLLMLYGPWGSGKSVLTAALAQELREDGLILWIDSSEGFVTLQNPEWSGLLKGVVRVEYREAIDVMVLANAIRTKKKAKIDGQPIDFSKVKVVVVDEDTTIYNDVLGIAQRERLGLEPDEAITETPDRRDYNVAANVTKRNFEALYGLDNVHIILTGHERTHKLGKDDDSPYRSEVDYGPAAKKGIARRLHVIGFVTRTERRNAKTKQTEYKYDIQAQPTLLVEAKSRISTLETHNTFDEFIDRVVTWSGSPTATTDLLSSEADLAEEDEDETPVYSGEEEG